MGNYFLMKRGIFHFTLLFICLFARFVSALSNDGNDSSGLVDLKVLSAKISFAPLKCEKISVLESVDEQCKFVAENCGSYIGFLDYLGIFYCSGHIGRVFILGFYLVLLVFLFSFISTAAGDFFCPNLESIASFLGLSEDVTGVTVLAFGNGSPDLFSTFSALKQNSSGLAIGELLGAGSFITTCVAGTIAIVTGFQVARRPFMRDLLFFIGALCVVIIVLSDGKISLLESIMLIVIYVFYVCVVVFGRWISQRAKKRRLERMRRNQESGVHDAENALIEEVDQLLAQVDEVDMAIVDDAPPGMFLSTLPGANGYGSWFAKHRSYSTLARAQQHRQQKSRKGSKQNSSEELSPLTEEASEQLSLSPTRSEQLPIESESDENIQFEENYRVQNRPRAETSFSANFSGCLPSKTGLIETLFPIYETWDDSSFIERIISMITIAPYFLLSLTIPVVSAAERESSKWKKWLTVSQTIIIPYFICFATESFMSSFLSISFIPNVLVAFVVSTLASLCFLQFTSPHKKPRFYNALCLAGFVTSVLWIYMIANELLTIFQSLGIIMWISEALIGLTVFAIGNSLGDFISNVSVARMGFTNMAVSACFGAPMLNILLGIGVSTFYINLTTGADFILNYSPTLISSSAGLMLALVSSAVFVPFNGWKASRKFGIYLISIYAIVMIINVTIELSHQ